MPKKPKGKPTSAEGRRNEKKQQAEEVAAEEEAPHPHVFYEGDGWVVKPPAFRLAEIKYRLKVMGRRHETWVVSPQRGL